MSWFYSYLYGIETYIFLWFDTFYISFTRTFMELKQKFGNTIERIRISFTRTFMELKLNDALAEKDAKVFYSYLYGIETSPSIRCL